MSAEARSMPAQKPGKSKQDYCTPREFVKAVEARFGRIECDLAATAAQRVCYNYLGPDHAHQAFRDSMAWRWQLSVGLLWLNPPYSNIALWAAKCAKESRHGAKIALLVPASVGSNWYWNHVAPYAHVYSVGRMTFVNRNADGTETPACLDAKGKPTCYPKDLIMATYGLGTPGSFERWEWRK